jgi:hypothetical protein
VVPVAFVRGGIGLGASWGSAIGVKQCPECRGGKDRKRVQKLLVAEDFIEWTGLAGCGFQTGILDQLVQGAARLGVPLDRRVPSVGMAVVIL